MPMVPEPDWAPVAAVTDWARAVDYWAGTRVPASVEAPSAAELSAPGSARRPDGERPAERRWSPPWPAAGCGLRTPAAVTSRDSGCPVQPRRRRLARDLRARRVPVSHPVRRSAEAPRTENPDRSAPNPPRTERIRRTAARRRRFRSRPRCEAGTPTAAGGGGAQGHVGPAERQNGSNASTHRPCSQSSAGECRGQVEEAALLRVVNALLFHQKGRSGQIGRSRWRRCAV
jgi:hypothetical protein